MVEIVHLQKRQQPPADRPCVLVECRAGCQPVTATRSRRGLTMRVSAASYPVVIAEAIRDAEETGTRTIYVRGAPAELSDTLALSVARTVSA